GGDAAATADGDGTPGDEVEFVALDDGTFVLESGGGADPAPFAAALGDSIATPYRALAVKRQDVCAQHRDALSSPRRQAPGRLGRRRGRDRDRPAGAGAARGRARADVERLG